VKARSGRKLRLKVGDVVAEGQTVEDIERLLKQAAELCAKKKKK
jgi:predicted RNase H-like HicB family nuclease